MSNSVSIEAVERVALVEIHRGPNNFFDEALLAELAQAIPALDERDEIRCIVLCSEGKHFCAGADLRGTGEADIRRIYRQAFQLFTGLKPIVAAVQGAAVGGGLGLALACDLRVGRPDSRFSANFARLGFHHGFGLSATLPVVIGIQRSLELLYTGRSVTGVEAAEIGLCDRLTDGDVRAAALEFAAEIALSAPLSLRAIRGTMRRRLVAEVHAALGVEADAQAALLGTTDFREGVTASVERRAPNFTGV